MSLLPPSPIVHSKCYFFLKNSLCQSEEGKSLFEEVIKRLPHFPKFRLGVTFRSIESLEKIVFLDSEIIDAISQTEDYSKVNLWDCTDIALNMYTRMKKPLIEKLSSAPGGGKKGVITFVIQCSYDEGTTWNDMYMDEDILRTTKSN
jgi:hypothetical protein